MAHTATATEYRPQSFSSLVGQDFVSTAIKNSLNSQKIANAFLLSGPRGVGKTTTARLIAKGLNCIHGPTGEPCNECTQCVSIKEGNNSDVIEIDGASNTSINNIKTIQEEIQYLFAYPRPLDILLFVEIRQKRFQFFRGRIFKNLLGIAHFFHHAVRHKDDFIGNVFRKTHFVRYNNHCAPVLF